jgi:hypothetical protein
MTNAVFQAVNDLVGLACTGAKNPYGSIISIDFGPLTLRVDDNALAEPHGWRHLTVLSPWRLQTAYEVILDWNVDGGANGLVGPGLQSLIGAAVESAETTLPGWDLVLIFSNGIQLLVFGDCLDERTDAWFILGTDGLEVAAQPVLRELTR